MTTYSKDTDLADGFFSHHEDSSNKDDHDTEQSSSTPVNKDSSSKDDHGSEQSSSTPVNKDSSSKDDHDTKQSNIQREIFSKKNPGGRPIKEGLKNEQFTLTMHPEIYEKLRIIATNRTRGNFSALIDDAIKSYCRENRINLDEIKVSADILDVYRQKQDKKRKRNK